MTNHLLSKVFGGTLLALAFALTAQATDISTTPLNTYSAPSSVQVKPNVIWVLDDSGSMAWDFMPDWACGSSSTVNSSCGSIGQSPSSTTTEYLFKNAAYNGIYYNPAVTYAPPASANTDGSTNTTNYPSMTGVSTTTGGDSSATAASPNWHSVKSDAYGVQSTSKANLQAGSGGAPMPYFFTIIPGVYCSSANLATCVTVATPGIPQTGYTFPAKVQWCNSSATTSCRANFNDSVSPSYNWVLSPAPFTATMTVVSTAANATLSGITTTDVSGTTKQIMSAALPSTTTLVFGGSGTGAAASTQLTGITVSSQQIMSTASSITTSASAANISTIATSVAAKINACTAAAVGSCTVSGYSAVATSTGVTITNPYGTTVTSSIVVAGKLSITTNPAFATPTSTTTVAQAIAASINNCTYNLVGNCTAVGYTASSSSNVVTITAPDANTSTPAITSTVMSLSATAFVASTTAGSNLPGYNVRTTLTSTINSYPYPGSTTKAAARTDCAGTTCTYKEEMTNYANWWTYYRTRMQTVKSAGSNAFSVIGNSFRVGFMTINNNTGSDFLNLGDFGSTQRYNWFHKLTAANPGNSTPLRVALATTGQLYGGVLNGTTLNGSTVADPLEYSCQQNYTILSTDGFWNESTSPTMLDKKTAVGNQDAGLARPYYDGGTAAQLESKTSTLQILTGQLQQKISGVWTNVNSCTSSCQYVWGSWVNAPTSNTTACTVNNPTKSASTSNVWTNPGTKCQYTAWPTSWTVLTSTTTSGTVVPPTCTPVAQATGPSYPSSQATAVKCQTVGATGGSSNSLADVAAYYYNTDLRNASNTTDLGSSITANPNTTGTCAGPIIPPATVPSDLCADNVPSNGRDVATTQHMTLFTLGLGSQGEMIYAPNDGTNYWNDTTGDFYDVEKGTTPNTSTGICSWQTSGQCNWPIPASNTNANIDDLWHAAVNGHGTYFSATDPSSLSTGLNSVLTTISNTPRPGSASAAAASSPNVSASGDYIFSSSYESVQWTGDLIRQVLSSTGAFSVQNWSAARLLDCDQTAWVAATNYAVGNVYKYSSQCYIVTSAYLSASSFGSTDTANTSVIHNDETATTLVAATPLTSRTIKTSGKNAMGVPALVDFSWSSLTSSQQSMFEGLTYTAPTTTGGPWGGLTQFCNTGTGCLTNTQQTNNTIATSGAAGEALVKYLAGDRTYEGTYYRARTHILGDIVTSQAAYVQTPAFNYADANYQAYKASMGSRAGAVYVGANDGMLHAFDASSGQENWAYVPSFGMANLYKLADINYSSEHQYFADGSPQVGDICATAPATACGASQWQTILVGGMNDGGKGYYALDITSPTSPKLLWEFSDTNMGYTYGNPIITKRADGTWVVLLTSGYNNADGLGHLYVLNAATGAVLNNISTGAGTPSSPSGLARISGFGYQPAIDNTTTAVYGGDVLGNLWRFNINATSPNAQLLASLVDGSNNVQPITSAPQLSVVNSYPIVYVGTGRYLGTTDVTNTNTQSFYAIKDNLGSTSYGNPRTTSNKLVQQTLTIGTCPTGAAVSVCLPGQSVMTVSANAVNWAVNNGWYLDFPNSGERSVTDPQLALGTLIFTTIVPQAASVSACSASASGGASSFLYALNYLTGGAINGTSSVAATNLGAGLATQPLVVELPNGTIVTIINMNGSPLPPIGVPTNPSGGGASRVSWRVIQ